MCSTSRLVLVVIFICVLLLCKLRRSRKKRLKKLKRGNATCRGPVCVQDDCSTTVTRQSCRGVHCASCTHVHSSPGGCPSPPVLIMCYVPRLYAIHMITALALASLMDVVAAVGFELKTPKNKPKKKKKKRPKSYQVKERKKRTGC